MCQQRNREEWKGVGWDPFSIFNINAPPKNGALSNKCTRKGIMCHMPESQTKNTGDAFFIRLRKKKRGRKKYKFSLYYGPQSEAINPTILSEDSRSGSQALPTLRRMLFLLSIPYHPPHTPFPEGHEPGSFGSCLWGAHVTRAQRSVPEPWDTCTCQTNRLKP